MTEKRNKIKKAMKDDAKQALEVVSSFSMKQSAVIQQEGETTFFRIASNDSEESNLFKSYSELSNGYVTERHSGYVTDKETGKTSTIYEVKLLRPDGTSVDITEMLKPTKELVPDRWEGGMDEEQGKKNQQIVCQVMENCKDLSENDKNAVFEFVEKLRFNQQETDGYNVESCAESSLRNRVSQNAANMALNMHKANLAR